MSLNVNRKANEESPAPAPTPAPQPEHTGPVVKFSVKVGDILELDYEGSTYIGKVSKIDETNIYMNGTQQLLNGSHFSISGEEEFIAFDRKSIRPVRVHGQVVKKNR